MMRPAIKDKLDALPALPGVYLMKDATGTVFYVGKATSLRDRVKSYFGGTDTRAFVALLEDELADLEVIITHSAKEALLVEDDLVKRLQPRFNVNLKDDKRYLCLRLDTRQPYPRLEVVRRFAKDGARYFGPYTSAQAVRASLRLVNRFFQLRTCADQVLASRTRPCLQYQIKRCPAPCVFALEREYAENIENVARFLEGRSNELVTTLRARMQAQAAAQNFEAAALLRDQVHAIERSLERQRLVTSDFINRDVVGLYREGPSVEIHVMRTREGRLIDAERFSLDGLEQPSGDILADFAARYYGAPGVDVPSEILVPLEMQWCEALSEVLSEKKGRSVHVRAPERGDKRHLVALAVKNATQAFADKQRAGGAAQNAVERLQRALHLVRPPHTLECFDISHLQGESIVASLVRFRDGVPDKSRYRHYTIRSTAGQDDFQSMYEVLSRRARRGLADGDLPDLVLIDGGKGQLNAARAALDDHGIADVDMVGLAKARPATTPASASASASASAPTSGSTGAARRKEGHGATPERVFVLGQKNAIVLGQNSAELFLLTRARDEAHRFAITFHRQQRRRAMRTSVLDAIPGVGPTRRRALLRAFGSLERVRAASAAELAPVVGAKLAAVIVAELHGDEAAKT